MQFLYNIKFSILFKFYHEIFEINKIKFLQDKRIQLKPDRFLESCPKLGFTLVACEQAKVLKDDNLKPYPLQYQQLYKGQTFVSVSKLP